MSAAVVVHSQGAPDTGSVARRVAGLVEGGDLIILSGDLGAGKTTFVQGLAKGIRAEGAITSPTFVLMRLHRGRIPLAHADAYRLAGATDLAELGIEELQGECVVALEWADTIPDALPDDRIEVRIEYTDEGRRLDIRGRGPRSAEAVGRMLQ